MISIVQRMANEVLDLTCQFYPLIKYLPAEVVNRNRRTCYPAVHSQGQQFIITPGILTY